MSRPVDGEDPQGADIVLAILGRIMDLAPGINTSIAEQVEAEIRQRFGGARVFVPKRNGRLKAQERDALRRDGMSDMSTDDVLAKHRVSRATLYRELKRERR